MGDERAAGPTREELERQLADARRKAFEAEVRANRMYEERGRSQEEREQAYADFYALKDEAARIELSLIELERSGATEAPHESILDELDAESEHAAVMAVLETGDGQTAEQAQEEAHRRNSRVIVGLAVSGSLLTIAALIWLASRQSPPPVGSASPSPGSPVPTTSAPTAAVSASPPASPTTAPITPVPLTDRPATGSSMGYAWFSRTEGTCAVPAEFTDQFLLEAEEGDLVMTQTSVDHVTTGTLTRSGASSGLLLTSAEAQVYDATVSGNTIQGTHSYSGVGCTYTYSFRVALDRPLLAPSPFSSAPGYFEFVTDAGGVIDLQADVSGPANLLLLSRDGVADFSAQRVLPIDVTLHVGETIPWQFKIEESSPPTPAPIPQSVLEQLFDSRTQPVLIAHDNQGRLLAAYAPYDLDWNLAWIAEVLLNDSNK